MQSDRYAARAFGIRNDMILCLLVPFESFYFVQKKASNTVFSTLKRDRGEKKG